MNKTPWIRLAQVSLTAALACTLAACGGGGGGSTAPSVTPVAAPKLALSASNATQVAFAAYRSVLQLGGQSSQDSVFSGSLGGATSSTSACALSGQQQDVVIDLNSNGKLDAVGEGLRNVLRQCALTADLLLDGVGEMRVTRYVNDLNKTHQWTYTALTLNNGVNFSTFDGGLTLDITGQGAVTIRSDNYQLSGRRDGQAFGFVMSPLRASVAVTAGPTVATTFQATATTTTQPALAVTMSTTRPFIDSALPFDFAGNGGILLITGDKGSAIKLEQINSSQLRLSLDADGDGAFESVQLINILNFF